MAEGIYDIFFEEVLHFFEVLYERICIVIAVAIRMNKSLRAQCSATNSAQLSKVTQTRATETILTLNGIALCTVKLEI